MFFQIQPCLSFHFAFFPLTLFQHILHNAFSINQDMSVPVTTEVLRQGSRSYTVALFGVEVGNKILHRSRQLHGQRTDFLAENIRGRIQHCGWFLLKSLYHSPYSVSKGKKSSLSPAMAWTICCPILLGFIKRQTSSIKC